VSLSPILYFAVKDLVAQRRYPSLSFCVESLIREALRDQAMIPYSTKIREGVDDGDLDG